MKTEHEQSPAILRTTAPALFNGPSTPALANANTALFRPEVLAQRDTPWLGSAITSQMPSHHLMAAFALLIAIAIVCLLVFGTFAREEQLSGVLVPQRGLARVFPPQSGVIGDIKVREGDAVKRGAALLTLSGETQSSAGGNTQAEAVRGLQSQLVTLDSESAQKRELLRQQKRSLVARIAALKEEEAHLQQEIALQQSRVSLADKSVVRQTQLLQKGFISEQNLQLSQEITVEQAGKLRGLMRNRITAIRDRLELEGLLSDLPMKSFAEIAAINRNKAQLAQEIAVAEGRREIVVPAPYDGTVTAIQAERGGPANTSTALMSIVPADASLEAHLYAPSRAIGFLQPGQPVYLRYQAFPYQKFGHHEGVIDSVSRAPFNGAELTNRPATSTQANEPVYRVVVRLKKHAVTVNGQELALQPGMQLDADVALERRRLIEWMLEPVYKITGRWHSAVGSNS